ncbi:hypothetical protein GMI70_08560 [Eggerthellaceae bacterium zg-893]|nr:hypothetical protein [Eggerthellaceae bacterium zg-893]
MIAMSSDSRSQLMGLLFLASGIALLAWIYQEDKKDREKESQLQRGSVANTRSDWEIRIVDHIRNQFPSLPIYTNDRTIIPSRFGDSNLEIDIWLPTIKLAIEANGEAFHDHSGYLRDRANGTEYSEEMYKEKYCARNGIKLIHVWDSQGFYSICGEIDSQIRKRLY